MTNWQNLVRCLIYAFHLSFEQMILLQLWKWLPEKYFINRLKCIVSKFIAISHVMNAISYQLRYWSSCRGHGLVFMRLWGRSCWGQQLDQFWMGWQFSIFDDIFEFFQIEAWLAHSIQSLVSGQKTFFEVCLTHSLVDGTHKIRWCKVRCRRSHSCLKRIICTYETIQIFKFKYSIKLS